MPRIDTQKFYSRAINKYGQTAKGLNWNSKKNQELRFEMILKFLPKTLNSFKLCDAGCGFGDFYHYLKRSGNLPKSYIGIDSLEEMHSIASKNTSQNILQLDITKNQTPKADYYVSSGALSVLTQFETYQFIQNCYKSSKYGFIFNALHGDKQSQTYNYLSLQTIQKIAKDLKVKKLHYKNNYMQNDITVGFFK